MSAITVDRRIWLVMPALFAGIGLMAAWPASAIAIFGLTLGASCVLLLVVLWPKRAAPKSRR